MADDHAVESLTSWMQELEGDVKSNAREINELRRAIRDLERRIVDLELARR